MGLALLGAIGAAGGCYHGSARSISAGDLAQEPGWVRVAGVPLVKQEAERDCGAAALAMVLARWGVPASAEQILQANPPAPGHGIAAGWLRDFARQRGLRAFLIEGELDDLAREAGANRPVLVGLVQRFGDRAYAHYEVVVGINSRTRRVLLHDPARGLRQDSFDGFGTEWQAAGKLALMVAPP
jgi:ABC-type bacteriocin/lantibiotic exporter with double-glycine peptidase domain